jgi:hypothetical protein
MPLAVPKHIAVALVLITSYDQLLGDGELAMVKAATHHDAHTLYLWHTVPVVALKVLSHS